MPIALLASNTLDLPFVDQIHPALVAFFRTSQFGEWSADEQSRSDQFELNFIRGKWRNALFGKKRVPLPKHPVRDWSNLDSDWSSEPANLAVYIRPSPTHIVINLKHTGHIGNYLDPKTREILLQSWRAGAVLEVGALREYLKECYGLPDLPALKDEAT